MPRCSLLFLLLLISACSRAQSPRDIVKTDPHRQHWVDSVYRKLSQEERVAQLFMVAAYSGTDKYNIPAVEKLIQAHQIGGLIFMQGGPIRQAILTNHFQEIAQVPMLISMDAEWGLGMRLDSVINLPRQMTMGATNDTNLAYALGAAVANQCKRIGVHIDFAPVIDVNNNPANPVINARSFGENKYKVARMGIGYMRGLQDNGVMACGKHFPGHGDVSVDSHLDMPVINKSKAALDTLELYPFRELIHAGLQSMMVAHLSIPTLEKEAHVPTTLSRNTITGLLKNELGFKGLIFTDAMNMQGITKYFSTGEADLKALMAGNDMLLFSEDVPTATKKILEAIKNGKLNAAGIETSVRKILMAKYDAGLAHFIPISTDHITEDLNQLTYPFNSKVADAAITIVRDTKHLIPIKEGSKVLEISMGDDASHQKASDAFSKALLTHLGYYAGISLKNSYTIAGAEAKIKSEKWDIILLNLNGLPFYPGKSYGLDENQIAFLKRISELPNAIVVVSGNAYALKYVCKAGSLICAYEDTIWTYTALAKLLGGGMKAQGQLPVTPPCLK